MPVESKTRISPERKHTLADGTRSPTYYAIESVGIATGLLVTAVHSCGLVALRYTPNLMGFLNKILGRPSHEKPFMLLVVGPPADGARVPDISRMVFASSASRREQLEQMRQLSETPEATRRVPVNE